MTRSRSLRDRLAPPMPGRALIGWGGPILVAVFAAVLRFYRLGAPHAFVFDETYYAKDALALLRFGVEHDTVKHANSQLLAGNSHIFTGQGSFVVHPPMGKWLIAVGEWAFGATPFGWRFAAAVIGSLSVLVLARVVRRMTRSTLLGCVAGLLLSLDALHFVHSRLALLDIFITFWVVAAFACLVADRDAVRARLADRVSAAGAGTFGPGGGIRLWRLGAGVCLGLACASKWNAIPFVAAFGLLSVGWDIFNRRAAGVRRPYTGALLRDAAPAFVSIVIVAMAVYVATWSGWFLSGEGWDRHWAASHAGTLVPVVPAVFQSWWHYQVQTWQFHSTLAKPHNYASAPWTWILLIRPVAYYYTSPHGCGAPNCSSAILGIGTPAIWWAAMPALLVMLWLWLVRRDWRAGTVVVSVAATWLPWFATGRQTEFLFYMLPAVPFFAIALTLCLGIILGRAGSSPMRRGMGAAIAGAYLLVVIANFWYLTPILNADVIPYAGWHARMWFPSWI
ncbi:MAG: dolichyl-phosphate-mannose--protein mannosyltransferase [Streptosporangiaceae bacterium]